MGEAREVAERWFEVVAGGDMAEVRGMLTDDCDVYMPGAQLSSADEAAGALASFAGAIPDARFDVSRWHELGDTLVVEGVYRGTHTGPLISPQGEIPATGNTVATPFATVFEVRDGRLSAHRAYWDSGTFMAQLGIGPTP
jgi:steroid delta-isomerase-like uncharacterized protein